MRLLNCRMMHLSLLNMTKMTPNLSKVTLVGIRTTRLLIYFLKLTSRNHLLLKRSISISRNHLLPKSSMQRRRTKTKATTKTITKAATKRSNFRPHQRTYRSENPGKTKVEPTPVLSLRREMPLRTSSSAKAVFFSCAFECC